ncbi:Uncharacterised protein [Burkholderia cepacia]|nr:hypothetical protein DM41_4085 [Burkholderia cepacia ATCC 25416]SPU74850.1 Uncharacterised protein [Burkholderia cepacia]
MEIRHGDGFAGSRDAYPFRMSLAQGQAKTIAVKSMHAVDTETVYRLDVRPAINASSEKRQAMADSIVADLGFSALVRQLPAGETATLSASCDVFGARLAATGIVESRLRSRRRFRRAACVPESPVQRLQHRSFDPYVTDVTADASHAEDRARGTKACRRARIGA